MSPLEDDLRIGGLEELEDDGKRFLSDGRCGVVASALWVRVWERGCSGMTGSAGTAMDVLFVDVCLHGEGSREGCKL